MFHQFQVLGVEDQSLNRIDLVVRFMLSEDHSTTHHPNAALGRE